MRDGRNELTCQPRLDELHIVQVEDEGRRHILDQDPLSALEHLEAIVRVAQELGRKVVAEGVERADDVAFLRSIGAEYAQGYYYGEAMPERDVMTMLRVIRKSERKLQRRGYFRAKPKAVETAASEPKARPTAPAKKANGGGAQRPKARVDARDACRER